MKHSQKWVLTMHAISWMAWESWRPYLFRPFSVGSSVFERGPLSEMPRLCCPFCVQGFSSQKILLGTENTEPPEACRSWREMDGAEKKGRQRRLSFSKTAPCCRRALYASTAQCCLKYSCNLGLWLILLNFILYCVVFSQARPGLI